MITLGKNIRILRQAKGLKAKDIADRADLTPAYVSRVENGRVKVSVDVLLKIARAMSIPVAAFFKDDEIIEELIKHIELTKKFFQPFEPKSTKKIK